MNQTNQMNQANQANQNGSANQTNQNESNRIKRFIAGYHGKWGFFCMAAHWVERLKKLMPCWCYGGYII